ncbi:MAG: FHA domain-containing protein [Thermoanaerobaculia bacterium]
MIIVECDRCWTRYRYDEARFEGRASKKLSCAKCHAVFEIYNTHAYETQPPILEAALPGVEDDVAPGRLDESPAARRSDRPKGRGEFPRELKLPANRKLSLAITGGPEAGRVFPIEKARVVIGGAGADVALEGGEISREHAAIEICGEHAFLVDLGSTTGTFIGARRVPYSPIENHGEFTVGGSTLMLIVAESE